MNMYIVPVGIASDTAVAYIRDVDADKLGVTVDDRLSVCAGSHTCIVGVHIVSDSLLKIGQIGLAHARLQSLPFVPGQRVVVRTIPPPQSLALITKRLDGKSLTKKEYAVVCKDIGEEKLTRLETAAFVLGNYTYPFTMDDLVWQTQALAQSGTIISLRKKPLFDLHCIGGIAGNRTTPIVVAILLAAGLTVPKTSSRAITSPSGTADTMEVLCPVTFSVQTLKRVIRSANGCIVFGGGELGLAPADDKIIDVEHALNVNATAQMVSSILAKKVAMSVTHLLLDIPYGPEAKVETRREAQRLSTLFVRVGKRLGITVLPFMSLVRAPVGHGIGPALEARDCLRVLQGSTDAPQDLTERSLVLAGVLLEAAGMTKRGVQCAKELLESRAAFHAFATLVKAQGGDTPDERCISLSAHSEVVRARRRGKVAAVSNYGISRLAKRLGAPHDAGAGVTLHVNIGTTVRRNQPVMTVYSDSYVHLKRVLESERPLGFIRFLSKGV